MTAALSPISRAASRSRPKARSRSACRCCAAISPTRSRPRWPGSALPARSSITRCAAGAATTVFGYGHGDVIRGLEPQWRDGLSPWRLRQEGDRLYGRGTADNKGQHTINLAALDSVLKTRGRLGFNASLLIETGEEIGSPGLREVCRQYKDRLAADVLIASDGPRLSPERPTIFLGARGAMNFDLSVELREGGHHSGNCGGLLANRGDILAPALATITTPKGAIQVRDWVPSHLPNSVRVALADCPVESPGEGGGGGPTIDP